MPTQPEEAKQVEVFSFLFFSSLPRSKATSLLDEPLALEGVAMPNLEDLFFFLEGVLTSTDDLEPLRTVFFLSF